MEIFKQLNKKGYTHYYSGTIEELDNMGKNNPDLHSEIMQVIMWIYEKHSIWISVLYIDDYLKFTYSITRCKTNCEIEYQCNFKTPTEAYTEAILKMIR